MASATDLVVITGATGKQSTGLIKLLLGKYRLRLIGHSASSVKKLQGQYDDAEIVQADMTDRGDCARILDGATTIYVIGPPLSIYEREMGHFMIDAAVAEAAKPSSKFKHYVMSSVLNSQLRKMANHDDKRYVEEYLIESGLNFTIVAPGDFIEQQFHPKAWSIDPDPTYLLMLSKDCVSSTIFLEDLAEAAAKVIAEREKHYAAHYLLVSNGPTRYVDLVDECSRLLGKPIRLEYMTFEDRVATALKYTYGRVEDAPARIRDKAEKMVLFYDRRGIMGNPNVLEWLLGRKPTTMADFVKKQLE